MIIQECANIECRHPFEFDPAHVGQLGLCPKCGREQTLTDELNSDSSTINLKFAPLNFSDSGWVLFYQICGWIGLGGFVVFLIEKGENVAAWVMLGSALSCFFAAHILRLQEKTAFFSEATAQEARMQTALLEKLSKESPPLP